MINIDTAIYHLPQELLQQLSNYREGPPAQRFKKGELQDLIMAAIRCHLGGLDLDDLLVWIYVETGHVVQRGHAATVLSRLRARELVKTSPIKAPGGIPRYVLGRRA